MLVDPASSRGDASADFRQFALPFDPDNLLEEAHESITLKEKDKYNDSSICEFIRSAPRDVLLEISYFCMEDPRLWDVYWEVIYDAAAELKEKLDKFNQPAAGK